jgi:hypothetical protein
MGMKPRLPRRHGSHADGDVAVGGLPITRAPNAGLFQSIAVERHVAILWLTGQHTLYSRIEPTT